MLNAIETDNMATLSENSVLEEKKDLSENFSKSIKILDQEPLEEIFEETKSIHDSVKVAIFRQAIFLIDPSLNGLWAPLLSLSKLLITTMFAMLIKDYVNK